VDNDCAMIQQVYSRSGYANLLRLSAPRHLDYALRHRMDYQLIMAARSRIIRRRNGTGTRAPRLARGPKLRLFVTRLRQVIPASCGWTPTR